MVILIFYLWIILVLADNIQEWHKMIALSYFSEITGIIWPLASQKQKYL